MNTHVYPLPQKCQDIEASQIHDDHGNICSGRNRGFTMGLSETSCLSAALPVCGGSPDKTRQKSKHAAQ